MYVYTYTYVHVHIFIGTSPSGIASILTPACAYACIYFIYKYAYTNEVYAYTNDTYTYLYVYIQLTHLRSGAKWICFDVDTSICIYEYSMYLYGVASVSRID